MAQKKAHEVDTWLKRPDPDIRMVLVYGPDRGLVSERARNFIRQTGLDASDPFSSVRLDAAEMESSPGRLTDEAMTVPMFADRRLVWVQGASSQKQLSEEIAALAGAPPAGTVIVIEAGDLKKGAALRSAVENARGAMALPCYPDEGRSIETIIDEVLSGAGLAIGMEARQALRANLGGDRLASRAEIEKLALYCHGRQDITLEDVQALTGDAAGLSVDEAVDAVLAGNAEGFDLTFSRLERAGSNTFLVLAAALRQFQLLHLLRSEMELSGKPVGAVVASARPPVFFARRKLVEAALQRWPETTLSRALERLQAAILLTRQRPDLATATARQSLMALLIEARRSRR